MNLLCHRLLQCEITLAHFSTMLQPHISYAYPTYSLISSQPNPADVSTIPTDHDIAICSSEDSSDSAHESSESSNED